MKYAISQSTLATATDIFDDPFSREVGTIEWDTDISSNWTDLAVFAVLDWTFVSAYFAAPNGNTQAGSSYVVFGKTDGAAVEMSSLPATDGFVVNGSSAGNLLGFDVNGVGDFNSLLTWDGVQYAARTLELHENPIHGLKFQT